MRTMSEAFADGKTIKCKCTEGRPDNGHSLVQCKRCENWLHVNCMLGEQYTFTQYEAKTGYKCGSSCDDYLVRGSVQAFTRRDLLTCILSSCSRNLILQTITLKAQRMPLLEDLSRPTTRASRAGGRQDLSTRMCFTVRPRPKPMRMTFTRQSDVVPAWVLREPPSVTPPRQAVS